MKHPPAKNKNQAPQNGTVQQPKQTQVSMEWSGPLPPPAALEHFDRIIPGGADRILKMVEHEQVHRFAIESQINTTNGLRATRGQIFGAALAALAIIGAIVNTYLGGPWQVGVALVGIPILGVAKALIHGRHS